MLTRPIYVDPKDIHDQPHSVRLFTYYAARNAFRSALVLPSGHCECRRRPDRTTGILTSRSVAPAHSIGRDAEREVNAIALEPRMDAVSRMGGGEHRMWECVQVIQANPRLAIEGQSTSTG